MQQPVFDPTGAELFDPANKFDGKYYLGLGALGQVHLSIFPFFSTSHYSPALYSTHFVANPMPVYREFLHRQKYFQTQTPYTELGYGSSTNKDYQIHIVHTQNIMPRWNVAFLYDLVSRDGVYTNSGVTDHILDVSTNYYSKDSRYQLQASVSFNKIQQQENGGVLNDTTCWDYSRRTGVPVNMYSAQNLWRDFQIQIHQSFNTVRQFAYSKPLFDTVATDSIVGYDTIFPKTPHFYNTGVFALDINFEKHRRFFYDNKADSWFYNGTALDTNFFYDSTAHYSLSADLYWTNDAYMEHRWKNPLVLLFGIQPRHDRVQFATQTFSGSAVHEFSLNPFTRASFNLWNLKASINAEETLGNRRIGDYRIDGLLTLLFEKAGALEFSFLSEAQSPDLIYCHNEGYYNWNYSDYKKIKRQQLALDYNIHTPDTVNCILRLFQTHAATTLIGNNIWFNSNMIPTQGDKTGVLLQASIQSHLRLGWFNIRIQEMFQQSSDNDVIRVPLFASKNSMYADFHMFHKALRVQTGLDFRYHTLYNADAWNPVLGTFYRQDNQKVGNYLIADFWIALQVKRASIYLKVNHLNAPLYTLTNQTPSYFSLPHYPMEDLGVFWGLTWKFFD